VCTALCLALAGTAAAGNGNGPPYPIKHETGVVFLHGGVGVTEREAMQRLGARYNLRLGFALRGSGAYLAGVKIAIHDPARAEKKLLEAVSDGPWFFARLPAGSYRVNVTFGQMTQSATVRVGEAGAEQVTYFYWAE
jgi:hypothetical protein